MNIKHVRLVLPARMKTSAQGDARLIVAAAARALQHSTGSKHPTTIKVQGQGRPATFISQSVFQETNRQVRTKKGEG